MKAEINPKYKEYFIKHDKLTSEVGNTVWVVDYDQFVDFFKELKEDEGIDILTKGLIALMATGGLRVSEVLKLKSEDFFREKGRLYGRSNVLKKKYLVKYKDLIEYRTRELDYKNSSEEKKASYQEVIKLWMSYNKRKPHSFIKEEFTTDLTKKRADFINKHNHKDIEKIFDVYYRTFLVLKKNPPKENIPDRYFIAHEFLEEIIEDLWTKRIVGRRMPKPSDRLFTMTRYQALAYIKKSLGSGLTNHSMRHSHISYLLFKLKKTVAEVSEITKLHRDTVANYQHYNLKSELAKLY
mgnify:CR=1 FL=1